jgi:membrane-anchored mycosin MYCP
VRTIVTPAWFSDYVLSVAAVSPDGQPMPDSINGPWVSVAAPGFRIMGLSSVNGAPVNALPDKDPGMGDGFWGTSFSAAYVSAVVAMVRAKFPNLTAHQVIRRITETAHNPARGWRTTRSARCPSAQSIPHETLLTVTPGPLLN